MANSWCAAKGLLITRLHARAPDEINDGVAGRRKCARLYCVDAANVANDVADKRSVWIDASSFNDRFDARKAGVLFIDQSRCALAYIVGDANRLPE